MLVEGGERTSTLFSFARRQGLELARKKQGFAINKRAAEKKKKEEIH